MTATSYRATFVDSNGTKRELSLIETSGRAVIQIAVPRRPAVSDGTRAWCCRGSRRHDLGELQTRSWNERVTSLTIEKLELPVEPDRSAASAALNEEHEMTDLEFFEGHASPCWRQV
jgi:hypothetical protein